MPSNKGSECCYFAIEKKGYSGSDQKTVDQKDMSWEEIPFTMERHPKLH